MFNRTTAWILVVALAAGIGLWAGNRWFSAGKPALLKVEILPGMSARPR